MMHHAYLALESLVACQDGFSTAPNRTVLEERPAGPKLVCGPSLEATFQLHERTGAGLGLFTLAAQAEAAEPSPAVAATVAPHDAVPEVRDEAAEPSPAVAATVAPHDAVPEVSDEAAEPSPAVAATVAPHDAVPEVSRHISPSSLSPSGALNRVVRAAKYRSQARKWANDEVLRLEQASCSSWKLALLAHALALRLRLHVCCVLGACAFTTAHHLLLSALLKCGRRSPSTACRIGKPSLPTCRLGRKRSADKSGPPRHVLA
jgi:hypothetical protein